MSCEVKLTDMRGTQVKHVDDEIVAYADFTPYLQYGSATISSATVSCSDDATIVLGTPSVVGSNTTVPWINEEGQVVSGTIAANKGVQVAVSGGTAQDEDAEPIRIWFAVTLSTGEIVNRAGRMRVEA